MHPADIQAAIRKSGHTQASIARQLKDDGGQPVTRTTVFLVVRGQAKSLRVARLISRLVGIPIATLWPDRYPLTAPEKKGGSK